MGKYEGNRMCIINRDSIINNGEKNPIKLGEYIIGKVKGVSPQILYVDPIVKSTLKESDDIISKLNSIWSIF